MATITTLLDEKKLIRVTVPLARRQFHERKIYASPVCVEWMRNDVPQMVTGEIQSDTPPRDQMILRLRQWMAGLPMAENRMFRNLRPLEDGVWELKTEDLRFFGWLWCPRELVITRCGYADHYKEPNKIKNYTDEIRNVIADRTALQLDGGGFAKGDFYELV
jgi:hypothetical protein